MMEEAEFLSTKMGIMIKGGIFKCFGSSQMIKQKYGKGFEIDIKIQMPKQQVCEQLIDQLLTPYLSGNGERKVFVQKTLDELLKSDKILKLSVGKIMNEITAIYSQTQHFENE
jgi:ABC-type multidrug transport system ATPase subunit